MRLRAGMILGALFAAFAVLSLVTPSTYQGGTCGSYVSPEWTQEESQQLASSWASVGSRADRLPDDVQAQAALEAARANNNFVHCENRLETRLNVGVILGFLALVVAVLPVLLPAKASGDDDYEDEYAYEDDFEVEYEADDGDDLRRQRF